MKIQPRLVKERHRPPAPAAPRQQETAIRRLASVGIVLFGALALCCDAGWVDPDTPINRQSTKALTWGDHREYELVRTTSCLLAIW